MSIPTALKFTTPLGNRSQDKKNKNDGCNTDREYNTNLGSIPMASSFEEAVVVAVAMKTPTVVDRKVPVGRSLVSVVTRVQRMVSSTISLSEDSTVPKVPDPGYDEDGNPAPYPPV